MRKVTINAGNSHPHFIGSWSIEPTFECEKLIEFFELNISKQKLGLTSGGLDINSKDSVDIRMNPNEILLPGNEIFKVYFDKLFECYKNYLDEWTFLRDMNPNVEIGYFNLQRYKPGQHFKAIHTERSSLDTLHRIFAFMTYLNDVQEGGSTYFNHYDIEIQPQKGLTLIWPAEWTHSHRGNILKEGSKYIITGWINFAS